MEKPLALVPCYRIRVCELVEVPQRGGVTQGDTVGLVAFHTAARPDGRNEMTPHNRGSRQADRPFLQRTHAL